MLLGLVIWLPKITNCMTQYTESNIMVSGNIKPSTKCNTTIQSNMKVLFNRDMQFFSYQYKFLHT